MRSVSYVGQLSGIDKAQALRNARAVVIPSISWEGLGLVVYEAYDYSRPVLVARSGGLPETVLDGMTGLVHEPGNATQLAEHIGSLESSAEDRKEMGEKGRSWLLTNANESDWQRRFISIADKAISCHRARLCLHEP